MKPFYYLSDFPERRNAGKNFVAECPKCGKKHLSISRETGVYHCFYAGCDFNGKLRDFWEECPFIGFAASPVSGSGGSVSGKAAAGNAGSGKYVSEVPMIPEDYKRVPPEIFGKIKPLTDDPETADRDQLAARRYLADQRISLKTAMELRVGYTKLWYQDSPTTPCAPYGIDCINPLLVSEDSIPKLVITEGGKDALAVRESGYPFVISVPNGAASDLSKSFEAFGSWLNQVRNIVICGDTDLPGRTLTKHLSDYFGTRCLFVILPADCKDIADVLAVYGAEVVREIIESAKPGHTADIITVNERADKVLSVLRGEYDHGYSVGYGPLMDRVFHPTDDGGLVIVTGKPNSGKTDFLNDLTCRLMAKTGRYVCYLSFEVPDKNKHIARLVQLMLGKVNTTGYTAEQLRPIIGFLNTHMVHLDLHEVSPTPEHIIDRADRVRRASPLKYLIIDPYLFMEVETGKNTTETQAIKGMLTQLQAWGRSNHIWVVIVAHPRKLQKLNGKNELEDIDMYTIGGSANWANLADFIFSISRIKEQDRNYTRLDMLKVRDQDLCQTGSVLYVRQTCGRYDERESEEQIVAEAQGKIMAKDRNPWLEQLEEVESGD